MADTERRRVAKERGKAFEQLTQEAWSTKPGKIFNWCKKELPAPIVATENNKRNGSFSQTKWLGEQPKDGRIFGRDRIPEM
eukprot:6161651-Heterocapsa_arctica.AAC.1